MGQLFKGLLIFLPITVGWAKYAGEFEALEVSARAVGMGGAYLALADEPAAIYYNPAGTRGDAHKAFSFMHAENFKGVVKTDFLSGVNASSEEAFGLAILRHGVSGIILTQLPDTTQPPDASNRPYPVDSVNVAWWTGYLNYSRTLGRVGLGGNLKAIYGQMARGYSFGMGVDLGLKYAPAAGLIIGVRARNLTSSPLIWSTKTRELILPRLGVGMAECFRFGDHQLCISLETEANLEALSSVRSLGGLGFEAKSGLEYLFKDCLAARFGSYHGCLTLGVGGRYRNFSLDYAFQQGSFPDSRKLGPSHRLSGGVQF